MATAQPLLIHLILRNHFDEHPGLHMAIRYGAYLDEGFPVLAFRDRERAEARREGLEDAARRKTDPVTYGNPYVDSPGPDEWAAFARAVGLEPPVVFDPARGERTAWVEWWRRIVDGLSPERVRALWDQFQGDSFYALTAVPLEGDLPRDARTVFVVRLISRGRRQLGDPLFPLHDHSGRLVFGRPERAFADPLAAEAFRVQAERRARVGQNPFSYTNEVPDPVADRTSLGYPLLHDWLLDYGAGSVPDSGATEADWSQWWVRTVPNLTPLQQARAWEAFDRIRFYDVVEVELDRDGRPV
jgi:hypothetical protein